MGAWVDLLLLLKDPAGNECNDDDVWVWKAEATLGVARKPRGTDSIISGCTSVYQVEMSGFAGEQQTLPYLSFVSGHSSEHVSTVLSYLSCAALRCAVLCC